MGGGQYPCGDKCATPCRVKHVVLKTDSAYLVNGITRNINKWQDDGWTTASNTAVKNQDLWKWLMELIDQYDNMDVGVDFWLVPRQYNSEADRLAAQGLQSSLILTKEGGFKNRGS
ncbi:ribonuclease H-like domain-containing protein [Apiospora saccharicola]|uniref:Ribonuclease H-like domain-containing protein n=1 Tax=Apiospora saccharicola TaxID=335842 RepID=A0ABR1WL26_9PEZI